ncbi:multidrug ABC transporter substrate-binding protein [Clostridia bacterium]|nr:multidrug ABC transporter substrate-binding protein [Clostridia bacterium]
MKQNKNILTIISIAIGVFSVVLISGAGASGSRQVINTLSGMGLNSLMVQSNGASPLTKQDLDVIAKLGGVENAMPLMTETTRITLAKKSYPCMVWGVSYNAREIISLAPLYGRLISDDDTRERRRVCVVDENLAKSAYGRSNIVGKSVRMFVGGSYADFYVVGVAKSGINALQSALSGVIPDFAYVPFTTAQELTGRQGYDRIAVLTAPADSEVSDGGNVAGAPDMARRIEATLRDKNMREDVTAVNLLSQKQGLTDMLNTVTLVLSLIAGVSLIVSGISVMTTMLTNVRERRREIGIKKSVGASDMHILREFLRESLALSARGAVIGTAAGVAASLGGCAVFGLPFAASGWAIAGAMCGAVVMGGAFGVYPAVKAAAMQPIDALRNV